MMVDDRRSTERRQQQIPVAADQRAADRRGGRPKRDDARTDRIKIRLTAEEKRKLKRVADKNGISRAAFCRDAISDAIEECCEDEAPLRENTPYTPRKAV